MKKSLLSGLFLVLLMSSAEAGQLFPPVNVDAEVKCPEDTFLAWQQDGTIQCQKGAHLADRTVCAAGMGLVYSDGKFVCEKIVRAADVPTCAEGQSLKYVNDAFSCVAGAVPSGTMCGVYLFWTENFGDNGVIDNEINVPCNGVSLRTNKCPAGYSLTVLPSYNTRHCVKQ